MSNVYSLLLDILLREPQGATGGLFGTITGISPLTVRCRGRDIDRGLFYPRGTRFYKEDIGREVALLPCEAGFLLFQTEGDGV